MIPPKFHIKWYISLPKDISRHPFLSDFDIFENQTRFFFKHNRQRNSLYLPAQFHK